MIIPQPAPLQITQALRSVEITQTGSAPSGFQLSFFAERLPPKGDYPLVKQPLLKPNHRVILMATVDGSRKVLMDGYITSQELTPGTSPGGGTLTVTGEDVSVKMDLYEIPLEYPPIPEYFIANLVLIRYAIYGVLPLVIPTPTSLFPFGYLPQQNQTDRKYVMQLAAQYGYVFYVIPGPLPGLNFAYWGPPNRLAPPQKTLTADMGPLSNVDSISFNYNSMAPGINYGLAFQDPIPIPLPILTMATTRIPALAADPPLGNAVNMVTDPLGFLTNLLTSNTRGSLVQHQGLSYLKSFALAQGQTDYSVDDVVVAKGELDTVRYGAILQAPGIVTVRGTGYDYDGLYYVKQVTHKMSTETGNWSYKQQFVLTREGLGSTV